IVHELDRCLDSFAVRRSARAGRGKSRTPTAARRSLSDIPTPVAGDGSLVLGACVALFRRLAILAALRETCDRRFLAPAGISALLALEVARQARTADDSSQRAGSHPPHRNREPARGVPRIRAELRRLGHEFAESTVAKYVPRGRGPRSQKWRTFLRNHAKSIAAVDFFTVPTVTFRNLYVFLVLRLDRRHVVHFAVRERPDSTWVARQLR